MVEEYGELRALQNILQNSGMQKHIEGRESSVCFAARGQLRDKAARDEPRRETVFQDAARRDPNF